MADAGSSSNNAGDGGSQVVVADLIKVTIKTIDSSNFQFEVESNSKIQDFKEKIAATVGIEAIDQRMIFCGRVLADDKTFKDYKIDDGKVIHLVKRGAPARNDAGNGSAQSTSGANSNTTTHRVQHQTFHGDSNPILMGTIAVDPSLSSNFLNQMMRQLFEGQPTAGNGAANVTSSDGRSRLNQIRRIHQFIRTSLAILESPHQFPLSLLQTLQSPTAQVTDLPPPTQPITTTEYSGLFQDTFVAFDRLRPHLNNFLAMLDNRHSTFSSPSFRDMQTMQANFSVLMRITHHLSHVLHLFTDFDVDLDAADGPRLGLNVLRNSQQVPSQTNASTSTRSSSATTASSAAASAATTTAASTGPTITTPVGGGARSATTTTSSGPSMFVAQSPIVMMEVDANDPMDANNRGVGLNINFNGQPVESGSIQNLVTNIADAAFGSLNNIVLDIPTGSRTINFSTTNDLAGNLNIESAIPLSVGQLASAIDAARSIASSISSSIASVNSAFDTPISTASRSTRVTSASGATTVTPSSASTSRGPANSANTSRDSLLVFDSFLPCDSVYTVPEVRSAAFPYIPESANRGSFDSPSSGRSNRTVQVAVGPVEEMTVRPIYGPDSATQRFQVEATPLQPQQIETHARGRAATTRSVASSRGARQEEAVELSESIANMQTQLNQMQQQLTSLDRPPVSSSSSSSSSSSNPPQQSQFLAFFELTSYLISQTNMETLNAEGVANLTLANENGVSPPIFDFFNGLNLFQQLPEHNVIYDLVKTLLHNITMEELFQMISWGFSDFSRFRQPFQRFIRTHFLGGQTNGAWSNEVVQRQLLAFIDADRELFRRTFTSSTQNVSTMDSEATFRNFIMHNVTRFLHDIMHASETSDFHSIFIRSLGHLVRIYSQVIRMCFIDANSMRRNIVANYINNYFTCVNENVRRHFISMINQRIDALAEANRIDPVAINATSSILVTRDPPLSALAGIRGNAFASMASSMSRLQPTGPLYNTSSIYNEETNEEEDYAEEDEADLIELATALETAIADAAPLARAITSTATASTNTSAPSTSSGGGGSSTTAANASSDWNSVVPQEWRKVIKEDLRKQKEEGEQQEAYSQAYLNGMSKKRRLENQPDDGSDNEKKPNPK